MNAKASIGLRRCLKAVQQNRMPWWLALVPLVLGAVLYADVLVPEQLSITSVSLLGTNLSFIANVPPGLTQVVLEMQAALNAPWEDVSERAVPTGGGAVTMVIAQPASKSCFFRLHAPMPSSLPQNVAPSAMSSELKYVTTESLGSRLNQGRAVFHF